MTRTDCFYLQHPKNNPHRVTRKNLICSHLPPSHPIHEHIRLKQNLPELLSVRGPNLEAGVHVIPYVPTNAYRLRDAVSLRQDNLHNLSLGPHQKMIITSCVCQVPCMQSLISNVSSSQPIYPRCKTIVCLRWGLLCLCVESTVSTKLTG